MCIHIYIYIYIDTCLTPLVSRRLSSKVANDAANSISRIRQVMP